ncbi:hypothetical protein FRACYDRAFT_184424 [Fragilariopsis cylindrus CCMP1102]|uniref:S-adenosyl-L-methionine-dependent methyltransferase n=1 Tax=Fragilariopsis cylindrus CCMP1102 TaxID=635003 RepID=A0A1E7FIH1_9STRA|nr:hypothetical protein FRACYDRAFT_184424 [Fragilariopsis cylindrus CCMP1102]|eukprot:OEU17573.1 hypothetical protein FRACYDRAFT_184424 [Fragilariopsis cylindrus CCMP1102]
MLVFGFSLDTTTPYHLGLSSIHQRQQFLRTTTFLPSVAVPVGGDDVLTSHDDNNNDNNNNNNNNSSKNSNPALFHTVQGVVCREVTNELPVIGTVAVLEATADSQEDLVNECLELEEEEEFEIGVDVAEGDPYGAVLWPAAWAVSNYMLSRPDLRDNLNSLSIVELGTGTGLVSISVAMGGAKRVIATDYEPLALALTRYAADNINSSSSSRIETQLLDLCDLEQQPLPVQGIDIVCAADIMYEPKTGVAMAHRAVEALRNNCRVIIGDSPGRAGRPAFLDTLNELGVEGAEFQETIGKTCSGPRNDLICGKGSTSVSDTPQELSVALLDLKPNMLKG